MALASREAKRFNHDYIGTEHVLLALVKEGTGIGANLLKNLDQDLRHVRLEVEQQIVQGSEAVIVGKLPYTPRTNKAIQYAIDAMRNLGHEGVGTEHLVLGLVLEQDGIAGQVLRRLGVTFDIARAELCRMFGGTESVAGADAPFRAEASAAWWRLVPGCSLCEEMKDTNRAGLALKRIAELRQTIAFLNDNQGCRGWCVLVFKGHAEHLAELPEWMQREVWDDVSRVAAAIRSVFPTSGKGGGPARINYECLGNLTPHIHWHVIPRHGDDPEPTKAVWGWPAERLKGSMGERERKELVEALRAAMGKAQE